jgi:hypothetical protein
MEPFIEEAASGDSVTGRTRAAKCQLFELLLNEFNPNVNGTCVTALLYAT